MNKLNQINTVGIIGYGNMGKAIMAKLAKKYSANNLFVYDHSRQKGDFVFCQTLADLVKSSDLVILAVKPKSFTDLAKELTLKSSAGYSAKLFVSVMAGIQISKISKQLSTNNIARCMPNLAMKVDAGVTGWIKNKKSTFNTKLIQNFFDLWGYNFEVKTEKMLDAVTALSGCGPAYFYFLTQSLSSSAQKLGLSEVKAVQIANQTFIGAARLFADQNVSAEELIKRVASKGGATEAAIKTLKKNKFPVVFNKGVQAAFKRAEAISKQQ